MRLLVFRPVLMRIKMNEKEYRNKKNNEKKGKMNEKKGK